MATKKASAPKAFITGIVCVILVGFGWNRARPQNRINANKPASASNTIVVGYIASGTGVTAAGTIIKWGH